MWKCIYVNQWGDLVETEFHSLEEAQYYLEARFRELGEPFGFRMKWVPIQSKQEL